MINPNTRRNVNKKLNRRSKKAPVGDGTIRGSVPGQPLLAWVTTPDHDLPLVLLDQSTAHTKFQRVRLGRDGVNNHYQVLGAKTRTDGLDGGVSALAAHALTHEMGGVDAVMLHSKQIVPLLVYASGGGMTVSVAPGDIQTTDGFMHYPGGALDLTNSRPAEGALWLLVQIDHQAGGLSIKAGPTVDGFLDLSYAHIPPPDAGCAPLGAVRLYAGQIAVSAMYQQPDVVDLRFVARGGATGAAALSHVTDLLTNGSVVDPQLIFADGDVIVVEVL